MTLSDLPSCPATLQYSDVCKRTVGKPGETHSYVFDVDAEDRVRVVMVRIGGLLEPEFALYNSKGEWAYCNHTSTMTAMAECTLRYAGTYTLKTTDHSDRDQGEYMLSIQRLNMPRGAVTIAFGQTVASSISLPMEYDFYSFDADVGDRVVLTVARSNSILEPRFAVYDQKGTWAYCNRESTKLAQAECGISNAGTYTIQVEDGSDRDEGEYFIRLQKRNSPAGALPIESGQTLTGSIESTAEEDYYTFLGDVDDKFAISVRRTQGTMAPRFALYNEQGEWAYCNRSSTTVAEATCTIKRAGRYAILITDETATDFGSYTITLQKQ